MTDLQEMWDKLDLDDNDQVVEAVLIAKVANFEDGGTSIALSTTNGMDWIAQLGLLHAAIAVMGHVTGKDDQ